MRKVYNIIIFVFAGLYGCLGEIIINYFALIFRGEFLWIYYNGLSASWESFILFGVAGVLAFQIFRLILIMKNFQIVKKENISEKKK